jgi:succinoglycan biosynthesis protein ExoM
MMMSNENQDLKPEHISVCICTFKRPCLLEKLLYALDEQCTEGLFSFSTVVVDNDLTESARDTVKRMAKEVKYRIEYYVEPRQNIALARNKAILNAKGDFIAMIDDDEVPIKEWLLNLCKTLHFCKADGVLGPVRPSFTPQTPQWLIKSGLCERRPCQTGKILTCEDQLRTGNVMVHRRIFNNYKNLFEEQFGRTGGEDIAFFDKRIEEGYTLVWCEEAPVYEEVTAERCSLSFYLKKYIRMGGLTGEMMRKGTFPLWNSVIKSICAIVAYPFILPVLAFRGKHVLSRHLVKYVYHISRLFGSCGIVIIRER